LFSNSLNVHALIAEEDVEAVGGVKGVDRFR
jgi:hypothetical protein